ncbi:hypothetical protein ACMC56_16070 [Campylobacterota bacterium DY0563]
MARIRRIVIPNTPHHVTQRGVRSMNIFFKEEDYIYYKKMLLEQIPGTVYIIKKKFILYKELQSVIYLNKYNKKIYNYPY